MDAKKDILGLLKTPLSKPKRRNLDPRTIPSKKTYGVSPKLYALTAGLAPLVSSIDVSQLKKRPLFDEKITLQWFPFTNSALKDNLQLYYLVISPMVSDPTVVPIKIKHLFLTSIVLEGNRLARGTRNERDLEGHLRLHQHQLINGQEKASDLKVRKEIQLL